VKIVVAIFYQSVKFTVFKQSRLNKTINKRELVMVKEVSKITVVTYYSGQGSNSVKREATFKGHISQSEVERRMLFDKQTPARRIEGFNHQYN